MSSDKRRSSFYLVISILVAVGIWVLLEKTKLDEIAKYSHFDIKPVKLTNDGKLVEVEVKKPQIKLKYR